MPELPEVETIRRALAPHLIGREVGRVEARQVVMRQGIDPGQWRDLPGRRLEAIERRGKVLLFDWRGLVSVVHLGMSGRLLLRAGGERAPHTHLVLGFRDAPELHLVDPRRFGMAVTLPAAEAAAMPALAALGADPLGPGAAAALARAAARSRSPIRAVLLDQEVLAGAGNIYANEALARAGVHPLRPANRISRRRLVDLAACLRAVLEEALAAGGTTLADGGFVDSAGQAGEFAVDLAVYGRENEPCRRCGARIRRQVVSNRSVFYCPRCQR